MSVNYDEFPLAARYDDARRVWDRFHDPKGLTTIGFGVDSIGAADLEKQLAFARALKAPSCIHVNETGTIDKLGQRGLLGPDFLVIHGNLITNADRIGSLTPGKRADIVLVRKGPFGDSIENDACAHVLLQTSPREIDTVLVDGETRMKGGKLAGFDPERAAAMVGESRRRILQ